MNQSCLVNAEVMSVVATLPLKSSNSLAPTHMVENGYLAAFEHRRGILASESSALFCRKPAPFRPFSITYCQSTSSTV
jgi:hypothetical protein